MAKKKVQIIDRPLTPTVLAKVKNQKFNPIGLILLFLLFGGVVYFLPDISKTINNYLYTYNDQIVDSIPVIDGEKYTYSSGLIIDVDGYKLKNFKIDNDKLTFNVVKTGENQNLKTILELYNSENELLDQFLIDVSIETNETKSLTYDIKDSNVDYFQIKKA